MIFLYKELLWSNRKEWATDACDVMDEHQNHCAGQKNSGTKDMYRVISFLWSARQNLWKIRTGIASEEAGIDWKATQRNSGSDENRKCSMAWYTQLSKLIKAQLVFVHFTKWKFYHSPSYPEMNSKQILNSS